MQWLLGGKIKMDDRYLLEHGYKQYPKNSVLDSEFVVACFQKRFDDYFGKKYFIDVKKWSHDYIPVNRRDEWWEPFSYTYYLYTSMYEEEKPIHIEFGSSWTLGEVEGFAEHLFDKMELNYYENWDGKRAVRPYKEIK